MSENRTNVPTSLGRVNPNTARWTKLLVTARHWRDPGSNQWSLGVTQRHLRYTDWATILLVEPLKLCQIRDTKVPFFQFSSISVTLDHFKLILWWYIYKEVLNLCTPHHPPPPKFSLENCCFYLIKHSMSWLEWLILTFGFQIFHNQHDFFFIFFSKVHLEALQALHTYQKCGKIENIICPPFRLMCTVRCNVRVWHAWLQIQHSRESCPHDCNKGFCV